MLLVLMHVHGTRRTRRYIVPGLRSRPVQHAVECGCYRQESVLDGGQLYWRSSCAVSGFDRLARLLKTSTLGIHLTSFSADELYIQSLASLAMGHRGTWPPRLPTI